MLEGRIRLRPRVGVGRTAIALALVLVLVVAAVAAYSTLSTHAQPFSCPGGQSPTFTSSTIKIGYVSELSGGNDAANGYAAQIGAELAVNQTNSAGGVGGKTIDLVVYNDSSSADVAVQDACALDHQDGVLAITGPTDLTEALAVEGYTEANSVPFVVSTVPSATLTPPGSSWTVNIEPDAVQWGAAVAKYVSDTVPSAKIAMMTQNSEQQNEMAAGVRWYANTYKNESIVFDQLYANAQFPWATAAEAAKLSGANAVVVSWVSTAGFSESNVIEALLSAGFLQDQIFVVAATSSVSDLGVSATGIREGALFDGAMSQGYPNASAFTAELQPFVNGELLSHDYCGVCPMEVGPIYYYSYLGMEMMINAIQNALSSGQTLTRANFMSSMKHASIKDAFGNALSIDATGASVGNYYIVAVGPLNSTQSTYPLKPINVIQFAPGAVPAYQLAKAA
jgi:ABC-type branched-subunit amino acid transport system substrate-binding protein